jgi:ABC-type lipoprotein export system ATPase subunit
MLRNHASTALEARGLEKVFGEGAGAVRGRRYDDLGDKELTRLRGEVFGFVFQFFNLLPTLTASENVLLPALVAGSARPTTPTAWTSCSPSWD